MSENTIIHVEILQKRQSILPRNVIESRVLNLLYNLETLYNGLTLSIFNEECELNQHIETVKICDIIGDLPELSQCKGECLRNMTVHCHTFQLNYDEPDMEELSSDLPSATQWFLPCHELHGLWESLIYDSDIKRQLISYITTSLVFANHDVDPHIIGWNKVVLLHGPPGTGKTSLCKALAQKVSIRLSKEFKYSILIEINSHSLFSKWFSESGKLVMKMFHKIEEYVLDPSVLVFVLIDEVESLAHARKASGGGSDPSDAVRVVNALLTQIDRLKRYVNVVILTTSNITGTIDIAFVDRADIKQLIGLPSTEAIYQIYHSCIQELNKAGLIHPSATVLPVNHVNHLELLSDKSNPSNKLMDIARASQGLSGRALRKIPFLAFALFISGKRANLETFLDALMRTVWKQLEDQEVIRRD